MTYELSITQARAELTKLPERLAKSPDTIKVTRQGKAVLAVLPWELYESILETMEVLGDRELLDSLRQSEQDIRRGRTASHEEVGRRLGLA
ncbi:MAG: type II toxin-antitoxin system Phd/YefM family antitoxin [Thermoanaerobaculia bacterium]